MAFIPFENGEAKHPQKRAAQPEHDANKPIHRRHRNVAPTISVGSNGLLMSGKILPEVCEKITERNDDTCTEEQPTQNL